jgi:glycogen operon protein
MILGGDEIGRSQQGNNNVYCQDSEIAWYDWNTVDEELLTFCRNLIRFRKSHPAFRRRGWFKGKLIHGSETRDIAWFTVQGQEMTEKDWQQYTKTLGVFLNGAGKVPNPQREALVDDNFYILINAHHESLSFTLPHDQWGDRWLFVFDTDSGWDKSEGEEYSAGGNIDIKARSWCVLRAADARTDP